MGIDGGKPYSDRCGRREAEIGPSFCARSLASFPVPIFAMCFLAMLGRVWSYGPVSWLHRTRMKHRITVVQSPVGLGAEIYRIFPI